MKCGRGACIFDSNHIELLWFLSSVLSITKPGAPETRWAPIKLISIERTTKITVFLSRAKHHKAEPLFSGQEHVIGVCIMILSIKVKDIKSR